MSVCKIISHRSPLLSCIEISNPIEITNSQNMQLTQRNASECNFFIFSRMNNCCYFCNSQSFWRLSHSDNFLNFLNTAKNWMCLTSTCRLLSSILTSSHLFLFHRYMGSAQIRNCSWRWAGYRTVWGKNEFFQIMFVGYFNNLWVCFWQTVRKGTYRGKKTVAVKMMKEGAMSEDDFIDEAKVMT